MKFAVLLVLLLAATVMATERRYKYRVSCPPGQVRYYNYTSDVNAFGTTDNSEKINFDALVKVECLEKHRKANGKDLFNIRMTLPVFNVNMKKKNTTAGWNTKSEKLTRQLNVKENGDVSRYFKKPIHASYTSNGKVVKVFHAKDEEAWVTGIKKSIFTLFQTKLTGEDREENDSVGEHKSHYNKINNKRDNTLRVTKSFNDRDMPRTRFEPGHQHLLMKKQMKMDEEASTIIDQSTGTIKEVVSTGSYDLGAKRERRHKGFFHDNQNVPYPKGKKDLSTNDAFKVGQTTALRLVRQTNEEPAVPKKNWFIVIVPEKVNNNDDHADVHPSYVSSSLNTDNLGETMRKENAKDLFAKSDFTAMIAALKADPSNHKAFADLAELVRADPNHDAFIEYLWGSLNEALNAYSGDEKTFGLINALRALLINTKDGARAFADSLKDVDSKMLRASILGGIGNSERWFNKVAPTLYKLYKSHSDEDIRKNAYLVLANALASQASNSPMVKTMGKEIISQLIKDRKNTLLHVHALGNAGKHIPLKFLSAIVKHPEATRVVRAAAINALRKRRDGKKLIQDLLTDEAFTLEDVSNTLAMLKERDPTADPRSLKYIARKYMKDPTIPHLIKHNFAELFHKRGHQLDLPYPKLVKLFKKAQQTRPLTEEELALHTMSTTTWRRRRRRRGFFRRIRRAVRRVARRVRRVVRRVGRAVRRVVRAIGSGVRKAIDKVKSFKSKIFSFFRKATFKGRQVCLPSSSKGDRLCVYDAKMVQYIQSQGSLAGMHVTRQFAWERLLGSDRIHAYIGIVAYAGTNLNCRDNSNPNFLFATFAKGLARIVAFSKEVSLVDAHLHVRHNPRLENHGYLKALKAVIFNRELISLKGRREALCKTYSKNLINKRYGSLPGYNFPIVIGPFMIEFGFGFTAGLSVDLAANYCFKTLGAYATITPNVDSGVKAHARLSIVIIKAGIALEGLYKYGLLPKVELEGKKCRVCATVDSTQQFRLNINGEASINIVIYKKSWSKTFISMNEPAKRKTLFKKCLGLRPKARADNFPFLKANNDAFVGVNRAM